MNEKCIKKIGIRPRCEARPSQSKPKSEEKVRRKSMKRLKEKPTTSSWQIWKGGLAWSE
jgi:hypothetical protein